ncbi:FecR domain-containing protein [Parabacteroides sp.]
METINEEILLQYIDGTLTASDAAAVEEWLAASPENEKLLEQLYFTREVVNRVRVMQSVDPEQSLRRFKAQVQELNKKVRLRRMLWFAQRVAAVLFIPIFVLSVYLWMQGDKKGEVHMVEMRANPGVVSMLSLPDGSRVWLNSASSLKYPSDFVADNREVELEGQGYFEVTHDAKQPFIVHAGQDYAVEVLGTTFSVAAYADDDRIETTLVEGSVNIHVQTGGGQELSRRIKPQEKVTFTKTTKELDVETVNTDYETAWKNGEIIFRNHPMSQVLKVLSRHYHVKFVVQDSLVLNSIITARFKDEQLPQVMEYLRLASGIKYTIPKVPVNSTQKQDIPIVEISK